MKYRSIESVQTAGIGLRMPHIDALLAAPDSVSWLELLADNWLSQGGITTYYLDMLAERFPLSLHGVGLSLGSVTPLADNYLRQIQSLLQRSQAMSYSEHLSFSQLDEAFLPDLLPLPYTEQALQHMSQRVQQVQDRLGQQLLIENVSSYVAFNADSMSEAAFLSALVDNTGCGLLLDVNNLYVNQNNLGRDARLAIQQLPLGSIQEVHLAGFERQADCLIDAHNNPVDEAVWSLYEHLLQLRGPVATLIEWDNDLPALEVLLAEQAKAQALLDAVAVRGAA